MSFIINPYRYALGASFGPGPNTLSNLELWLDAYQISGLADGAQISTWLDSSGNGRDATGLVGTYPTKPKYRASLGPNSQPTVEMSAATDTTGPWFSLPNFLTGFTAGDIFAVVKINGDPPNTLAARCAPPYGDFGSAGDEYFPNHTLGGATAGVIFDAFGSTVRKQTVNPTPALTSWRLYESRSASGAWSNHLDGVQLFSTATNTVGWSTTPFIGHSTTNNKHLNGFISEIILYSRILNDTTERKAVIHAYLNTKYGLSLPI